MKLNFKVKIKFSTGFHSRHFYSAAIAVKAFRALGVNPRKIVRRGFEPRVGGFVASLLDTLTARPLRILPRTQCNAPGLCFCYILLTFMEGHLYCFFWYRTSLPVILLFGAASSRAESALRFKRSTNTLSGEHIISDLSQFFTDTWLSLDS